MKPKKPEQCIRTMVARPRSAKEITEHNLTTILEGGRGRLESGGVIAIHGTAVSRRIFSRNHERIRMSMTPCDVSIGCCGAVQPLDIIIEQT